MNFQIDKRSDVEAIISQINNFVAKYIENKIQITELVTISSEIIYNIIKFSDSGEFSIEVDGKKFVISAKDNGHGFIENFEDVLKEGYSTAGSLGLGIPSIIRLSDDLNVTTTNNGTFIKCTKRF